MSPLSPKSSGAGASVPKGERSGEGAGGGAGSATFTVDSFDEHESDRPRLQRAHGPSKKTFKFRRSRHANTEAAPQPQAHARLESDEGSSLGEWADWGDWGAPSPYLSAAPAAALSPASASTSAAAAGEAGDSSPRRRLLVPAPINTDTSYDSEISQTSSTSGYRESYSLQASMAESPGCARGHRSPSATPHASPDASLSCESGTSSAERTALLGAASQRSLLLSSDLRDEDTLI